VSNCRPKSHSDSRRARGAYLDSWMRPPPNHAHPLVGPIAFTAALLGWSLVLAPMPRAPAHIGSAVQARPEVPRTTAPQPSSHRDAASQSPLLRGSDVIAESYPVHAASVRAWRLGDRVELPDPAGGTLALRVERVEADARARHLTLLSDGLV